jgi:AraC-like DNA-binding protein
LLLFIAVRSLSLGYYTLYGFTQNSLKITAFFGTLFPCAYLYFKNLTNSTKRFKIKELVHFIAPILFGLFLFLFYNKIYYFKQLGYFCIIIFGFFYKFLTYNLLKNQVWNRATTIIPIQKQNKIIKNWSIFFFTFCLFLVTRILFSLITDLYFNDYLYGGRYFYISLIITLILYIKILATPEILYGYTFFVDKIAEQYNIEFKLEKIWHLQKNASISNIQDLELQEKITDKITVYIRAIETSTLKNNLLRDETLTLGVFAQQVGIPKSHVVFLFKYHSNMSFIEFTKIIRTLDAIGLIKNNFLSINTLESLAKKVGFASYNTFFTSFKEITGTTPKKYCNEFAERII